MPDDTSADLCSPEWMLSAYVDDELAPEHQRPVEAHLIHCLACRERVLALQEEAGFLRDLLQERSPQPVGPEPARAPARGLVLGLAPSVLIGLALATGLGWLWEVGTRSGYAWLNPIRWTGGLRMAFDAIFLLRDEAPALFQLAVSIASLASVAFLLTVAFGALSRRWLGSSSLILLVGAVLLLGAAPAFAVELWIDPEVPDREIPAGQTLEQNLVVSGRSIVVAGRLEGDLLALAERVRIVGEVNGDVLAITRDLEVDGLVTGSVHALAERAEIRGEIRRSVYTATDQYLLDDQGRVGLDGIHAGTGVTIEGSVARDVFHFGDWLELRGSVGRDLESRAERVSLGDEARVEGDLTVLSMDEDEPALERMSGAFVGGRVVEAPMEHPEIRPFERFTDGHFYLWTALSLAGAFLVGMLLFRFLPWVFDNALETTADFFRAAGFGLLFAIATPVVLIVLAVTIVALPIALMGAAIAAMVVYAAEILVAAMIGEALLGAPAEGDWAGFGLPLLAGLAIVTLATLVPYLGSVVSVVVVLLGLGLMVERVHERWFA